MIKKQNNIFIILIILILASLSNIQASHLKKVTLQLMWLDQFEFAGFYIAKEKGYYKDVGLDVNFKKFTPNTNVLNTVLKDEAQFGISSSSLLIDKSKGKDVLLLGTIFQSSPLVLLALKDSNIKKIEDIKGKKIMISKEEIFFVTLQTMLKSKNIKISDLEVLDHSFNIDDLIDGTTDLILAYSTNEPYSLKEKGYESQIFNPKDYGFDFYEDLIFTTNRFQKENPKTVHDFYDASIKGWKYAFENIQETAKIIFKKYNPQNKSLESLIFEANEIKKLALKNNIEFGTVSKDKLKLIENSYKIMGLIKNDLDINQLLHQDTASKTLNMTALEKAYLKQKKEITMCVDPNWMPYEKIQNGKHIGMSADFIKLVQNRLNIPITLIPTNTWAQSIGYGKNRTCDIFSLVKETPSRRKYMNFTKPYFNFPLVVATSKDKVFISNIKSIINKKLGIVKGYAFIELLKEKYPNINIVEVDSVVDGLQKVQDEKIYGFIDSVITIDYELQRKFSSDLKVSGQLNMNFSLSIAARNDEPQLYSILQKALLTIDENTKQKIINEWISIKVEKEIDYSLLWKFVLVAIIIFMAFTYRHYLLTKTNNTLEKKVEEKTNELQKLNENLEKTIQKRTEDLEDSNEVFKLMLHSTMEAIFILEYNYCVDANKEAIRLFDYENNDALVGKYIFDLIDQNSHEFLSSHEDLSKGVPYEIKAIKKDGSVFPGLIRIQSLNTKNRTIKILTLLDLTQVKEHELKLINQSKMASLGELIGNIAHQWRQPLAAITTAASGMRMQKELDILSDDDLYTNCDDIVNSSNYLSETINNFKTLIKGTKTKKDYKINETIKQGISLATGLLSQNAIKVITNFEKEEELYGYPNDITQVIIDILKNSNDAFTQNNSTVANYIFITTTKEANSVIICIKDNAGGISPEILNKIFEPYFTTKHQSQGTGLGMYMVHQIIHDHFNGDIEVTNEEFTYNESAYKGVQITITLPIENKIN